MSAGALHSEVWRCQIVMERVITLAFFFNDTAATEIYTLSSRRSSDLLCRVRVDEEGVACTAGSCDVVQIRQRKPHAEHRSEEHTSELQSQSNLVCRLLLDKKKILHFVRSPLYSMIAPPLSGAPPCLRE